MHALGDLHAMGARPHSALAIATVPFAGAELMEHTLRQLMAGNRKFSMEHVSRDDIASLTRDATEVSGISYITEVDHHVVEEILAKV